MALAPANFNRIEAAAGRYRPDIDGLRAIAVLSVVLFHFHVGPFTGGFVGVDVFFVISGFLITRLIWNEIGQGHFSYLDFYERRVRRILPALFAVLAVTTLASLVLLFPKMLANYAMSLIATAGFASNFHFWGYAGYWAPAASEQPLLHTWSLAVEEQFYLIFPALLGLFRHRSQRALSWTLAVTLVMSLVVSVVSVRYSPMSAFYLLPSRFWELLTGSVLAVAEIPRLQGAFWRNAAAILGLALIACSVFTLSGASPFPGLNAIPPCLGAGLIIYAGMKGAGDEHTPWINAALSTRVPVFVGLISYSLYLWHWPIYVLATITLPHGLGRVQSIAAIAVSFALAILSWRFVEQPFRGHAARVGRKPLFVAAGSAIAVCIAVGIALALGRGLPQRYDADTRRILAEADYEPMRASCFNLSPAKIARGGLCRFGAPHVDPTVLLWGDSHADAIVPGVLAAALAQGKAGLVAAHGHCAPFVGVTLPDPSCRPFNDAVARIAQSRNITVVLLDARWATYTDAASSVHDTPNNDMASAARATAQSAANARAFADALTGTIRLVEGAGKRVIIIGPVPDFQQSVPIELAKMRIWRQNWDIAPTRSQFLTEQSPVMGEFLNLATDKQATVIWPDQIVCPDARCATIRDGRPLYRDDNHLSVYGAQQLAPLFRGLL